MKWIYAVVLIALCSMGCGKNADPIPNVAVNFQAPLTDPRLSALNSGGGVVLINGYGIAGLILYHSPFGGYLAYDRCSSYKPENKCAVKLDPGHLTVTDPCSGSIFSLADGTPQKRPATESLKSYYVTVSNYEIFVSN
jgi:nitrite reductase/ring-hydroxylating ferredoxin subunit